MIQSKYKFCGDPVTKEDITVICEVIDICGFNRTELANTVCEIMNWVRPNGNLKRVECLKFFDQLRDHGLIKMPEADPRSSNLKRKMKFPRKSALFPIWTFK